MATTCTGVQKRIVALRNRTATANQLKENTAMTRNEWIERYIAAMLAGGSEYPEWHLRSRAEQDCNSTEESGCTDPDDWEEPETIAEEHLESE